MFLVDTNVFLEILLEQENSEAAEKFITETPPELLHISDFSLYSVGILLSRTGKASVFVEFTKDVIIRGGVTVLRLSPLEFDALVSAIKKFELDFDDAYQYTLAKKYGLKIVSFDSDFDKTDMKRLTPLQALGEIRKQE